MPPSALFYNDALEPCALNGTTAFPTLSDPEFPIAVFGMCTDDETSDEGASWFNDGEVHKVVKCVEELMENAERSSPKLKADQIVRRHWLVHRIDWHAKSAFYLTIRV